MLSWKEQSFGVTQTWEGPSLEPTTWCTLSEWVLGAFARVCVCTPAHLTSGFLGGRSLLQGLLMETAGSLWSPIRNAAPARAGRMLFVATVRYRGDGWVAGLLRLLSSGSTHVLPAAPFAGCGLEEQSGQLVLPAPPPCHPVTAGIPTLPPPSPASHTHVKIKFQHTIAKHKETGTYDHVTGTKQFKTLGIYHISISKFTAHLCISQFHTLYTSIIGT